MKAVIICIGNRYVAEDCAGLEVFDRLRAIQPMPCGVEVVEGGVAGLGLLPLLEQGGRVVFVDSVRGFAGEGEIVVLGHEEILRAPRQIHFDHGAGLPYLLAVLPKVCDGQLPEDIVLLGLEGSCTANTYEKAAGMSLAIAMHGVRDLA